MDDQKTKQTGEIDPDAIKAHIKRNQRRYKTAAVFLAGTYFGRKYGPVRYVDPPKTMQDLPKEIGIVATFENLKKLIEEPKSCLYWTEPGEPTITLITEAHPSLQ